MKNYRRTFQVVREIFEIKTNTAKISTRQKKHWFPTKKSITEYYCIKYMEKNRVAKATLAVTTLCMPMDEGAWRQSLRTEGARKPLPITANRHQVGRGPTSPDVRIRSSDRNRLVINNMREGTPYESNIYARYANKIRER